MSPSNWWAWLRGFWDEVWCAKPAPKYLTMADFQEVVSDLPWYACDLSADLILPDDVLDDILLDLETPEVFDVYAVGAHTYWFVADAPDTELSRREYDRFIDDRNARLFWQQLIDSQEGE